MDVSPKSKRARVDGVDRGGEKAGNEPEKQFELNSPRGLQAIVTI